MVNKINDAILDSIIKIAPYYHLNGRLNRFGSLIDILQGHHSFCTPTTELFRRILPSQTLGAITMLVSEPEDVLQYVQAAEHNSSSGAGISTMTHAYDK
jgi:hypothetical protein